MSNPAITEDYAARQEARKERLEKRVDKLDAQSTAAYEGARETLSGFPMGQPILVGHHSERGHRRALDRADNKMRRSVELGKQAGECRAAAAAVGTGGISTVDPEAIELLQEKLTELQTAHETRKRVNRIIRKHLPITNSDEVADEIVTGGLLGRTEARSILDLSAPPRGQIGYPDYQLRNATAEIRRLKQRIASIEALRAAPPVEHIGDGWSVRTENGQVQVHVAGSTTPCEIRAILKRAGFKWSRYSGCWVRKYTPNARSTALLVIPALKRAMGDREVSVEEAPMMMIDFDLARDLGWEAVRCQECGVRIAVRKGTETSWGRGTGVSDVSGRELCWRCLKLEAEASV